MKIAIKVKPNSKENSVAKTDDGELIVRVKAPAKEGKANAAVTSLLSEYLHVPKSRITVLKGLTGKNKIISIS